MKHSLVRGEVSPERVFIILFAMSFIHSECSNAKNE
jgi:hypothetical protein